MVYGKPEAAKWGTSINSDLPHTSQHMLQMSALQDAAKSVNTTYSMLQIS